MFFVLSKFHVKLHVKHMHSIVPFSAPLHHSRKGSTAMAGFSLHRLSPPLVL